ncbi:SDR family NAD(P)-dependent oxidoreductase [Silanimonas sp.]|jgi:NAD(P)-dependent dehydrogenase (short-subunit alcohol dehydrogenase family)|uniref:SDR family NAD(P)-dependent oxidoreductase n=1 Tax=Silanimonas sp. TaxID=1929290 RepID=UPI0022C6ADA4|nr:SDR family NAD(P)-dependent oxidoreductase [Silanimonas sp.]MCZ8062122.1 SDR family NAD(P)-dependent oxidoreductase [Silanimonas sp.]MCZ8114518.1 SDR family NAD(P)-dependent oxidoreductase [Silanimonas sp.]
MEAPAFHPLDLTGRHYLVTGAASGIGRAVAVLMARLGARLSLVDIDTAALENVRVALPAGSAVQTTAFDLRDAEAIGPMVEACVAAQGPLHGIVHCAGLQSVMPVRTLKLERARELFAVNTEAALALSSALASRKVYAGEHGALVFISSVMAMAGSAGAVAYATSKAALHGMARTLSVELAPKRIRVNCIAPGFVRTPLLERTERLWEPGQRESVEAQHPLGFGEPEDIANAVVFLAADTGRWITGTVLVVDGGYLAH